jgi:glutamate-1-semialdehyde aminotransferase
VAQLIPGGTSTGSKRAEALFGSEPGPRRLVRSQGARVWDETGAEYLDWVMALGAVALGYGHPDVTAAVQQAAADGVIGPLPPVLEEEVAALLVDVLPGAEMVRFLKTGAEGVAAAVRIARVATGRELVVGCGYHGWLDWSQAGPGVPQEVTKLFQELPFNDPEAARQTIRALGDRLAVVVVEPVVLEHPSREWLATLRDETWRSGAILVFDEIKTGFRIATGGAAERYGVVPDLAVVGKALANGYPLAAVAGRRDVMEHAAHTWISSTLATETVSLAAAKATIEVFRRDEVTAHLGRLGGLLVAGLHELAARHPAIVTGVAGIAEMSVLAYADEALGKRVVSQAARRGVLFKRTAYNFVSLAHDEADVERTLAVLEEAVAAC